MESLYLNHWKIMINILYFSKKIYSYLKPSNPSLAIMEGDVLFGIEPSIINIRKAKYTIGEELSDTWNDKKHSAKENNSLMKIFKNGFVEIVLINILKLIKI